MSSEELLIKLKDDAKNAIASIEKIIDEGAYSEGVRYHRGYQTGLSTALIIFTLHLRELMQYEEKED